ncbi:MAG: FKBP-type peptidyl-prolyl cis-trans isomerase [Sphingomonas sp.]|nr:FKBP-type peptidyl-prolyl cis-trans isomerase [Sphingomonas sp.]
MSVAEAAHRPARSGRTVALSLAFFLVIAAAIGLAWIGAGSLRPVVTESGLQFRTIKAGTGEPITRADAALLEYVLTSDDGTVVDASQQPTPFTIDGVYPGFGEAMARMQEGGEYRFSIPQKLTGGATMPPSFPKDSRLNFDVRIRKIARGGAAMLQQMQAQQIQQMEQQQQGQAPQQ